jgi:hypothetical protein
MGMIVTCTCFNLTSIITAAKGEPLILVSKEIER